MDRYSRTIPVHTLHTTPGNIAPGELRRPAVLVLTQDEAEMAILHDQLSYAGFPVHTFSLMSDLQQALSQYDNAVVLMELCETAPAIPARVPIIYISTDNTMAARIAAVRAGGEAFLSRPLNIADALEKLESLPNSRMAFTNRILLVNGQHSTIATLRQAGMEVENVHDPLTLLSPLETFHPDLILLDINTEPFSGKELITAIRQINAFEALPIILISNSATQHDGYDELHVPVTPEKLISAINRNIRRTYALKERLRLDNLTGLYNITTIKNHLMRELSRAVRNHEPLTLAIIDIDQFKNINRTYGHTIGDLVIQNLAHMLKQRLRTSDLVGRIGADQFVAILVNCDIEQALQVMDEIRGNFSKLSQCDTEFNATFTCGIANNRDYQGMDGLWDAAEHAVYLAKNQGKNQVIIAEHEVWDRY